MLESMFISMNDLIKDHFKNQSHNLAIGVRPFLPKIESAVKQYQATMGQFIKKRKWHKENLKDESLKEQYNHLGFLEK